MAVTTGPALLFLARHEPETFWGIADGGAVVAGGDNGGTWWRAGGLPGTSTALLASGPSLYWN